MQNNDQLRTIKLYGELAQKFGRIHRLAVDSAAEAVIALGVLNPGFEKMLMNSHTRGVGYKIFDGRKNLGSNNLNDQAKNEIKIIPIFTGSKRGGLGQILMGVVIVIASIYAPQVVAAVTGSAVAGGAGVFGLAGGYALAANMGIAIALGGVAQLLSPSKKSLSTQDGPTMAPVITLTGQSIPRRKVTQRLRCTVV